MPGERPPKQTHVPLDEQIPPRFLAILQEVGKTTEEHRRERPTIYTPEAQSHFLEMVCLGMPYMRACHTVGWTYSGFKRWKRLWRRKDASADYLDEFFRLIPMAEATSMAMALKIIREGRISWTSAAWFLERKFPKEWLLKSQGQLRQPEQFAKALEPEKPLDQMTDEELAAHRRMIEAADVNAKPAHQHANPKDRNA